jgi:hypothetical protein
MYDCDIVFQIKPYAYDAHEPSLTGLAQALETPFAAPSLQVAEHGPFPTLAEPE